MNDFLIKLFSNPETATVRMELFSPWHIMYVCVIILFPFVCTFLLRNSTDQKKNKMLRAMAMSVFIVYITDFFIQPFYNGGDMIVDKLPFHICTFLCPVLLLAQFTQNKWIAWFYDAIALLAIVAPFMYFAYPNTAFGDTYTPWCYRVIQTFLYHGLEFSWGVLALTLRRSNLKFSVLPRVLIIQCIITVWASIGNFAYDYNWYFLKGIDLGFAEIKYPLTYPAINAGIFTLVMLVFGIDRLAIYIAQKHCEKQASGL